MINPERDRPQAKVCMLVRNNFTRDSRVLNEALTLEANNFAVTVIALQSRNLPVEEQLGNIKIKRVKTSIDRHFFRKKIISLKKRNSNFHREIIVKNIKFKKEKSLQIRNLSVNGYYRFQKKIFRRSKNIIKKSIGLSIKLLNKLINNYRIITNKFLSLLKFIQAPFMKCFDKKFKTDPDILASKIVSFKEKNSNFHRKVVVNNLKFKKAKASQIRNLSLNSKNRPVKKIFRRSKTIIRKTLAFSIRLLNKLVKADRDITNKFLSLFIFIQAPFMKWFAKNFKHLSTSLRMTKAAISVNADIYHAHDLNTMLSGYLAARRLKRKLFYDSHELFIEKSSRKYTKYQKVKDYLFERMIIKKATKIITVNRYIASKLSRRYKVKVDQIIMNCPVMPQENVIVADHEIDDLVSNGDKLVLYVGAITFGRGIEQLIRSVPLLKDNIKVAFLGGGNQGYIEEIDQLVKELNVSDRITFFPPVSQNHVVSVASRAHVGVAPIQITSLNNYYSSPNKLFQYIMAGLPIIASDIPFYREIIVENEIGMVFDSKSYVELAKCINDLTSNNEAICQMKERLETIKKIYCWETEGQKLIKLYFE